MVKLQSLNLNGFLHHLKKINKIVNQNQHLIKLGYIKSTILGNSTQNIKSNSVSFFKNLLGSLAHLQNVVTVKDHTLLPINEHQSPSPGRCGYFCKKNKLPGILPLFFLYHLVCDCFSRYKWVLKGRFNTSIMLCVV